MWKEKLYTLLKLPPLFPIALLRLRNAFVETKARNKYKDPEEHKKRNKQKKNIRIGIESKGLKDYIGKVKWTWIMNKMKR